MKISNFQIQRLPWPPCHSFRRPCSDKVKPLIVSKKFPLNGGALQTLTTLATDLSSATVGVVDEDLPATLETDASENAISATLNQQEK